MNPTSVESTPPPSLEKSEENPSLQPSNQPAERMANSAEGQRKGRIKWSDSVGMRFGRLEVVSIAGRDSNSHFVLECRCDCGVIFKTTAPTLLHKTRSCGCLRREVTASRNRIFKRTHGHTIGGKMSKMYFTHKSMIERCHGHYPQGERYRKRGIKVCDRWRFGEDGKTGFECFLEDMPHTEDQLLSIDRINNDGDYTPENCRWATAYVQNNNTSANHSIEHDGITMNISQWEEKIGASQGCIYHRLKSGWTIADAVTKRPRKIIKRT